MPDWFAMGTQFHPEADSASALDMRIFEEFVDAVREAAGIEARPTETMDEEPDVVRMVVPAA